MRNCFSKLSFFKAGCVLKFKKNLNILFTVQAPRLHQLMVPRLSLLQTPRLRLLPAPHLHPLQARRLHLMLAPRLRLMQAPRLRLLQASPPPPNAGCLPRPPPQAPAIVLGVVSKS